LDRLYRLLFYIITIGFVSQTSTYLYSQQVIRWGADPSGGAPYVFTDPENPQHYIGYEKDIVDEVAKVLKVKIEFVPADWESCVPALIQDDFDFIQMGLEPTGDRAKVILFSNPYYLFRLQLTVRKDVQGVESLDDCIKKNMVVGTLVNTAASRLLDDKKVKSKGYQDPVGAYEDLEFGRVDAVIMDVPAERFYAKSNPNLKPAGKPFHTGAYVIGFRKSDATLKAKMDSAITILLKNGTLERIYRKWDMWDEIQPTMLKEDVKYEITEKKFNWGEALLHLLNAALITVGLAFGAMFIAVSLGLFLSIGQSNGPKWVSIICTIYIEFFRGTPVLVQLLFLYFGLPNIGIALPGWLTALVGLGLNYAAYESQIYRAAFQAVPKGQWDVSYALGMNSFLAFRRIILPQAFRIALPPMTNDFVALFKDTSAAFAIAVWELATAYRELANASMQYLLLGAVVSCFYLAMSLPLAHYARRMEKRLLRKKIIQPQEVEVTS
jgi:polar amino acid transport system substrate-binding protein